MAKRSAAEEPVEAPATSDGAILAEARERWQYAEERDGHNRKAQLEDTRFVYEPGAQWDEDTRRKRGVWKLPCLEFNQTKQFVSQVVNDQRQGRPGVRFHAASGDASKKVADLKQDLVRGIEYRSSAEAAYDTGFQHAVVGGRGYWRIRTDWETRKSFNQVIVIDRVPDPQAVRIDPDYVKADGSDAQWAFVCESISKAEYQRKYKAAPLSWSPATETSGWYPDDQTVIVADYYRLVTKERKLALLHDGSVVWEDEVPEGAVVISRRAGEDVVCEWYTLAGGEKIVRKNEWRGSFVPVVLCAGDEIVIDGKRYFQGLIRHARSPQQLLNYGMTQQALALSLTPRPPWVAALAAIKGHEALYQNASNESYAVLPYNHKDESGDPVPPPQRAQPSFVEAGWATWVEQMMAQVKSTIGMYDPSLGNRSNETSGRAIIAREAQGDTNTYHYIDNLSRAIAHTGRIIEDLIPHIYDVERLVPLVAADGKVRVEPINARAPQASPDGAVQYVVNPDNDLTRGEYSVTVESGPSYATKREDARATLIELFRALPQAAQVLGDKLVGMLDLPDAEAAADRMKALLPPMIQQMEAAKAEGRQVDPQMMQQMQQMQQQMQQMGQFIQQLQGELEKAKAGEASKMATARLNADVTMAKAEIDAETKLAIAGMTATPEFAAPGPQGSMYMGGPQSAPQQAQQPMPMQPPMPMPQQAPQQPMVLAMPPSNDMAILQGMHMLSESLKSALLAPRESKVIEDADGNVVGSVSTPIQ